MPTIKRLEKIVRVAKARQTGAVVLEDIYDPHNATAVLRSCEAFGIQKVFFIFEKQKKFNPKKIGKVTSASANKWLDFQVFDSTKKCFSKIKKLGYSIVGTVLDEKAKSLFKTKFNKPKTALVFGNEHSGLSQTAIDLCDSHIYIPMNGFVQSLNLSVTAAVCLYELTRQRQSSDFNSLLSSKDQASLIKAWKTK